MVIVKFREISFCFNSECGWMVVVSAENKTDDLLLSIYDYFH